MPQTFSKFQAASVVKALYEQVTGKKALEGIDAGDVVSMADATLQVGVDPLVTAISQVYTKDIFSYRPYRRALEILDMGTALYGGGIRKFTAMRATDPVEDNGYQLTDGQSVDQYIVSKPKAVQTNFYGSNVWQSYLTIYENQLRSAFRSLDGVQEFLSMTLGELENDFEQEREGLARATLLNFIGAINATGKDSQKVHLLTEYNAFSGGSFDAQTIMQPDNIKGFMQWMAGRILELRDMMARRHTLYHLDAVNGVNGVTGTILRHTPRDRQRLILRSRYNIFNRNLVLANTFHPEQMDEIVGEAVPYWQNPADPDSINLTGGIAMKNDGSLTTEKFGAWNTDKLIGVLYDVDAMGYSIVDEGARATPENARGRYYNMWWNWDKRYINDQTENGILLMLD